MIESGKETAAKKHSYREEIQKATLSKNGKIRKKCTVCDRIDSREVVIYSPKSIRLSKTQYTFDGKTKKPSVTITDSKGKKLVPNVDYTMSYGKGRKAIGKYEVTVKFRGKYSGTAKKSFTIVPAKVTGLKLKKKPAAWTASWNKSAAPNVSYELQYSTDRSFKGKKTKTISAGKKKTISKTVTGLKGKTKYYVRIRAYTTIKTKGKTKLVSK